MTPLQKLPKTVGDLSKIIVVKGFKKSPKVQKNCQIWTHCPTPGAMVRVVIFKKDLIENPVWDSNTTEETLYKVSQIHVYNI